MTTIITRAAKGDELSHAELDANLINLNNDKAEVSALAGKADASHAHNASAINAGILALARLPVADSGESSATELVRADDSRLSNPRTPVAHTHNALDIAAGTLPLARGGTGAGDATAAHSALGAAGTGAIGASGLTMPTARLLGRTTSGTGAVEPITVGTGLSLSGGTLSATGGGSPVSVEDIIGTGETGRALMAAEDAAAVRTIAGMQDITVAFAAHGEFTTTDPAIVYTLTADVDFAAGLAGAFANSGAADTTVITVNHRTVRGGGTLTKLDIITWDGAGNDGVFTAGGGSSVSALKGSVLEFAFTSGTVTSPSIGVVGTRA